MDTLGEEKYKLMDWTNGQKLKLLNYARDIGRGRSEFIIPRGGTGYISASEHGMAEVVFGLSGENLDDGYKLREIRVADGKQGKKLSVGDQDAEQLGGVLSRLYGGRPVELTYRGEGRFTGRYVDEWTHTGFGPEDNIEAQLTDGIAVLKFSGEGVNLGKKPHIVLYGVLRRLADHVTSGRVGQPATASGYEKPARIAETASGPVRVDDIGTLRRRPPTNLAALEG